MNDWIAKQETPPALIYVSSRRYLYLGRTQLRIRDLHSAASALLVCLEGSVKFRVPGEAHWITTKSILIPAGSRIGIDNQGAVMAACYLDAAKPDFLLLRRKMESLSGGVYYNLACENRLTESLIQLREDAPGFAEAQRRVESIIQQCGGDELVTPDPRVVHVIERLRDTASLNISVKTLAEEVGLSESGLIRLFGQHVGAPLRRHRLWYRLIEFVTLTLSGVPSAVAIKAAGFTDAAHFSRCYSGFFGVNWSYAFSKNTHARYILEEPEARMATGDVIRRPAWNGSLSPAAAANHGTALAPAD
ncbi:helix-turn-helix domain-containing protein [Aquipseudomonas ullengensis]|uniref:Helix-turn-helix transcriptional regulator n=1 Tax=Aquipseudomonas ullengensis TaxID=2759166 RepID=A0A7W4LMP3_9GAMM|nr:AraC family transcriptional regulator [Pseudomonas ullengensis]MBB2495983.1 helix-turn-helix transcriptional regulator [Pseudomonas ullengensis]